MARKKTYYTADETTNNLLTTGKEWMTEDGVEYKGAYHRYITGETYTESTWNFKTSKKLIRYENFNTDNKTRIYKKLKPNIQTNYSTLNSILPRITNKDIQQGYINRYFFKKYDSDKIIETDKTNYDMIISESADKKLYKYITFKWYITGEKQDTNEYGIRRMGVITKNSKAISAANKSLPGILNLLTNPLQYYMDRIFITPTDINGLDS